MSETAPNAEQARYWNDNAGQKWVTMQEKLDRQLEPLGHLAMDAIDLAAGARVLDVGCGAGDTSLELAKRVAPGAVLGVDISAVLLERARARSRGVENVRFAEGDAQTTAFAERFDAVFSRFGVMFFVDPIAAFANLRSALAPGGRLGFVCWRSPDKNPTFTLPLTAALSHLAAPPTPTVPRAPGPFAFADEAYVHEILTGAGYSNIIVAPRELDLVFGGGGDLEDALDMALRIGPLSRALAEASPEQQAGAKSAVREALRAHLGPDGVRLPAAVWLVTARP